MRQGVIINVFVCMMMVVIVSNLCMLSGLGFFFLLFILLSGCEKRRREREKRERQKKERQKKERQSFNT